MCFKYLFGTFNSAFCLLLLATTVIHDVAALFEGCDYSYNIGAGYSYLNSPYYPNKYPPNTSCRYKFVAPLDYEIQLNCTVDIPQNSNTCSTDHLYLSRDGDIQLRGSEQFCGRGTFIRTSNFRQIVLAYDSQGGAGTFRCSLYARPQACDCGWYANSRIVNGQQTRINEYPSMAYLKRVNAYPPLLCGSSIISHRHAITAAHCASIERDVSRLTLVVGDHNLNSNTESPYVVQHGVQQILIHPNYNAENDRNDIAIVYTSSIIEWSKGVGPICLPPPSAASNTFALQYVDVLGWGTTSFAGPIANTLQKVTLQVMRNPDCQRSNPETIIHNEMICTYDYTGNGRDSCQYDSGGPVIIRLGRQFLVGVISFGQFCGQSQYASGVNTRITSFITWIRQNTGGSTCTVNL